MVVFDGYTSDPSTKDHEHRRRTSKASKISPEVALELTQIAMFDQDAFLANSTNKKRFLDLLILHLSEVGFTTHQGVADADVDIVRVAIQLAVTVAVAVAVVAQDTDILALLLYHQANYMQEIFFFPVAGDGVIWKISV